MHNIHSTDGIVLAKRGVGEGNSLHALLTRELGLVRASARSTRFEKSKLRYGLEPFSRARFSLVRGKHEWRLVGVEQVSRECLPRAPEGRQAAGRVARLLSRLIQGEEKVSELYQTVVEGLACLSSAEVVSKRSSDLPESAKASGLGARPFSQQLPPTVDSVECVLVLRVLAHLGYLPRTLEIAPFIETDFFSLELAAEAAASRALLVRLINDSLQQTGL